MVTQTRVKFPINSGPPPAFRYFSLVSFPRLLCGAEQTRIKTWTGVVDKEYCRGYASLVAKPSERGSVSQGSKGREAKLTPYRRLSFQPLRRVDVE